MALRFLLPLLLTLGLVACSLDPQPEPPMAEVTGFGGSAGSTALDSGPVMDAGRVDANDDAFAPFSEAGPCPGCAEDGCDAGDPDCVNAKDDAACDGSDPDAPDAAADAENADASTPDADNDDALAPDAIAPDVSLD